MPVILALLGAMIGAMTGPLSGAVLGGVVGFLLARSMRQQHELDALRQRLTAKVRATPAADMAAPVAQAAEAQALPAAPAAQVSTPVIAMESGGVLPAQAATLPPPAPPDRLLPSVREAGRVSPPPPGPLSAAFETARQWLLGGNTIVKAGIGILFIGLAFLAKYAAEHVEVPIELRLAGIGAAALALLGVGWRLRTQRAAYAQVLQGGAVAVLYLTLFTAFRAYGVIGAGPAFAAMAAVAALAAALAVLQDALALAVIGAIGGFATPLLLSTGGGNHVGLFSYYLVLDLGIAAVAWFRTWRLLTLVGFGFTFGVGTLWGMLSYHVALYPSAQAFLIVFFLLFVAVLLMPARRVVAAGEVATPPGERWVNGSLLFGLPTITFGLQYGLVCQTEYGVALSALVLAAFYLLLARALRRWPRLALAFEGCLAVGAVLLTLVIPFALEPRSTAGAWALEGAGLVWLGWRQARRLGRAFGYLLLCVAGVLLVFVSEQHALPSSVVNATAVSGLMLFAGALIAAYVVQVFAPPGPPLTGERAAEALLIAWALIGALWTVHLHLRALVPWELRLTVFVASVSVIALLFVALAHRLRWRHVALPALGLAPVLLLAAAASAAAQDQPFSHGGWWAWPVALATHAIALRLAAPHWPHRGSHLAHALGALVIAALGAQFGRAMTRGWGDAGSAWPWLGWLAAPALLLLALPWPGLAQRWPVCACPPAYRRSAGVVLAIGMLLWTLLANLISNGAARPLPHIPLVNPLDLGIALALVAAWRWATSDPVRGWFAPAPHAPVAVLGGAIFVWLNAMLVRAFHHLGGVPFHFTAWVDSLAVQTGLTLLWTTIALALMWWSARRARRAPWMVGAVLLAGVVVKLMIVDLSGSGTVTRIVSFIGVGVLMLVIGYVAPLPGREARDGAG